MQLIFAYLAFIIFTMINGCDGIAVIYNRYSAQALVSPLEV